MKKRHYFITNNTRGIGVVAMSTPANVVDSLIDSSLAGTRVKYYNSTNVVYLQSKYYSGGSATNLNNSQLEAMDQAAQLWEDVAVVDWTRSVDDASLAYKSQNKHFVVTGEYFDITSWSWVTTSGYWAFDNNLPTSWNRITIADLNDPTPGFTTTGLNSNCGYNNNYREITYRF